MIKELNMSFVCLMWSTKSVAKFVNDKLIKFPSKTATCSLTNTTPFQHIQDIMSDTQGGEKC